MKKIVNGILTLTMIFSLLSCEKDLMEEINDMGWNNERNILDIGLKQQIGLPRIERIGDKASITIMVNANGLDLKAVDITDIVLSYGAKADVTAGGKMNFDNVERKSSISVTSKKGEKLKWDVVIEPFINDLEGSWSISSYYFAWDDYNGYGNQGGGELALFLTGTAKGLDDIITFGPVEGANDDGLVYGKYERTKGVDGFVASFTYDRTGENWSSKFDQIPIGIGRWILNKDKSVTIVVLGKAYNTKIYTAIDEVSLKIPLDPGINLSRINWNDYFGDSTNKFDHVRDLYYILKKI
jgi:hypothetical protein